MVTAAIDPLSPTTGGVTRAGARQAYTLIVMGSLPTLAIASLVPVLPALFARFKNAPHAEWLVPMILTVPSLCVALFSAGLGAAADRWGRRRILLLALVAFGLFGTAPMMFDDLHAIIASRFMVGIAEATILTVGNALMGDYFGGAERKRWLGLQMSFGPIISSGYILAGGALGSISWHGPFALYALGLLVLVPAALYLFEPAAASGETSVRGASSAGSMSSGSGTAAEPSSHFPWRATLLVGAVTIAVSIVYFVQAVQHGRIFGDLGVTTPSRISLIVTLASIGTVIGGYTYRRIRLRPVGRMLALVFFCFGFSYVGVSLAPGYVSGALFDSVGQFAGGFAVPLLIAWALTKYDHEHRGRGMGVWAACFFVGQFFSPPVLSLIAHGRLSFLATVGIVGAGCLAAGTMAWFSGGSEPTAAG